MLLLLSCIPSQDHAIVKVSGTRIADAFVVGPPVQKASWVVEPSVRVCANTKVNAFRARKAMQYWVRLGYRFDGIIVDPGISCSEPRYGEIVITLPEGNIKQEHMAATRIYTEKNTTTIAKAKIYIYPRVAPIPRVLEHELGHALGWNHYPQRLHIMHPDWIYGGYGSKGLKRK